MITGFCLQGLLDEAKDILRKMEENGCLPNNVTYNVIVQGFLRCGKISELATFMKEMAGKGFSFDATTAEFLVDVISENPPVLDMIPELHSKDKKSHKRSSFDILLLQGSPSTSPDNFDEIVLEETKDVLVEFFPPCFVIVVVKNISCLWDIESCGYYQIGLTIQTIIVLGRSSKSMEVRSFLTEESRLITVTLETKVLKAMQLITALDILQSLATIGSFPPFQSLDLLSKGMFCCCTMISCKAENPGKLLLEWSVPYPSVFARIGFFYHLEIFVNVLHENC
ncbi:pentatricopeptide repeat-containing protein At3g04760, chloroplastic-like [Lycium ferocissimum]|uniref:pentatricopeptide repeat-containing protein At3g04760, chloroplastic-like n=1 Tax=Lycium ferocissimum TaxID=112874 RepID=UPI002814D4FA|nr:pentatricopeptide repeat-containing protein At3g04760, chloroplastic-like [Lycium ferocissimum]